MLKIVAWRHSLFWICSVRTIVNIFNRPSIMVWWAQFLWQPWKATFVLYKGTILIITWHGNNTYHHMLLILPHHNTTLTRQHLRQCCLFTKKQRWMCHHGTHDSSETSFLLKDNPVWSQLNWIEVWLSLAIIV